jgi:hypothetical protein
VFNVGLCCDVWLRNVPHVVILCVHVAYVARWVATAVFGEVAHFSAVKAGSFRALVLVGLFLGIRCVAICFLRVNCVGVRVVAPILALVVWGPSA